jgi:phage head maturation protease
MNQFSFYITLQKREAQGMVFGYASTEAVDSDGETIPKTAVSAALNDYLEWGDLREMHQPSAVGKIVSVKMDAKGLYIQARVVDDSAWAKIVAGVYRGFSFGGKVIERDSKNWKDHQESRDTGNLAS